MPPNIRRYPTRNQKLRRKCFRQIILSVVQFCCPNVDYSHRNPGDPEFAALVDGIGNGAGVESKLQIRDIVYTTRTLTEFTFSPHVVPEFLQRAKEATLAPTDTQVDVYNDTVLAAITAPTQTYLAADKVKEATSSGM